MQKTASIIGEGGGKNRVEDTAISDRMQRWAALTLFALLVLFAGIALFHSGAGAFFRVPQNFNEGWNAYFARAAYEGVLYFPYDAPVTNNYPPLSFYLIGGLAKLGGDPLYIGRFLSGSALILVGLNIYAILRSFNIGRLAAAFCAVAFLGLIAIGFPDYVATNDPQWLGHCVMVTGLMIFLRGYPRPGVVVGCALIMLAAGLIKHNLLPVPVAVTVWLLLYDRRGFWLWMATCALGGSIAAGALWLLHGPIAFESIFLLKRSYLLLQVANALYEHVALTVPLLVLFLVGGPLSDKRAQLIVLYAVFALVWDLYTMSAVGVAYNGILDYYIAVALLTGLALGRLHNTARVAAFAAVTLPLVMISGHLTKPHRVLQSFRQLEANFREDVALVHAADGPAMCYTAALCYWAGKAFDYDHFNEVRKMDLDPDYREKFKKKLDDRYFAIIQLKTLERVLPIHRLEHLPNDVIDTLNRNYIFYRKSETGRNYYIPRR